MIKYENSAQIVNNFIIIFSSQARSHEGFYQNSDLDTVLDTNISWIVFLQAGAQGQQALDNRRLFF